jgi:hypothetical protein
MRLVLARMLWNFDLVLSEEQQGGDWADQAVYILWQKESLNVQIIAREVGNKDGKA